MQTEEFEILLSRLATGELDAASRNELNAALESDRRLAARHDRFAETLELLDHFGPADLQIPELEGDYDFANDDLAPAALTDFQDSDKVVFFPGARSLLAAAATIMIAVAGWVFFGPVADPGPRARVTHVEGACRSDTEALQAGQALPGVVLSSGPDSTCDLRIRFDGEVLVRLLPGSTVDYHFSEQSLSIGLERGEIIVDARRHPEQGKIRLHTPGHLVELLGTHVAVHRPRDEHVRMELIKGSVNVRTAQYLHMKGLRHGLSRQDREQAARLFPELFGEQEHELQPGENVHFWHPEGHQQRHASLFEKLQAHFMQAMSPPDRQGAHRITPEVVKEMKSIYGAREDLLQSLPGTPPSSYKGKIASARQATLRGHVEHAGQQAARHQE